MSLIELGIFQDHSRRFKRRIFFSSFFFKISDSGEWLSKILFLETGR